MIFALSIIQGQDKQWARGAYDAQFNSQGCTSAGSTPETECSFQICTLPTSLPMISPI